MSVLSTVQSFFELRVQEKDTVGLKVNGVWYGRPWDEYWFYSDCSYNAPTQTLRIEFGSDKDKVVECCCIKVGMDDDGFLGIEFKDARVYYEDRVIRSYKQGVFLFFYLLHE